MKKIVLILLLLLVGCSTRDDFYKLSIDDYVISVGYDNSEYMNIAFDYTLPQTIEAKQTINDVSIYLFDELLGVGEFTNSKNKVIESKDAKLTKLTIYLNDLQNRAFKLNDEPLDSSIKTNCIKYNGTYVERNGYACIIEKDSQSVVELYGDYLNIDQDELDHIVIYAK